jgi:putative oxidoreductase
MSSSTALGLLLLRVSLATMWIAHAMLKLVVFTLPGTAQYFASIGLPGPLAYLVFVAELLGGLALLAGVYARQVSLALIPILLAAAWVHGPNGWVHTSTGGGWEYPLFLAVVSLVHWLLGDGDYSVRRSRAFTLDAATA